MTAKYRNFSYTAKREYQNKVFFIVFLVVFTFLSYILITSYLLKTYRLQTDTMFPEISTGDMVLMTPIYSQASAKRGDLVVIDDTLSQNKSFFKSVVNTLTGFFTFQLLRPFDLQSEDAYSIRRIVGLPGDTLYMENFVLHIKTKDSSHFLTEFELAQQNYDIEVKDLPEHWDSSLPFSGAYPETVLKEGEYFVLCDNRIITDDSRLWGAVEGDKKIYGKIILKYWPFKEFKSY
ncbi:signal peptidase I [Treponema denticola]|uniref:Signal peptidase I n=3 Tax=Treponema denticola TaxID=158 RepID=Q73MP3_TREDE|nr:MULTISPECIES: signal peptidase I [Treponema]AAS11982.1 signal peptidase I, putative [Treponema denticola ATCC 35405]EGC77224.1 signal peptidase I [Treponema denticola F0402]EMB19342.1 signal peptidase I [Treponema denticola OTK]EMB46926.1 signal peptidase I [Treponema denticola AL-2]UTC85234.1 signal peptidase I [Treponema denticola]